MTFPTQAAEISEGVRTEFAALNVINMSLFQGDIDLATNAPAFISFPNDMPSMPPYFKRLS